MDVRPPDEPLAAQGLLGLRGVDKDAEVPLSVRGHEAQVSVVDDELAGVHLQRARVLRDHRQGPEQPSKQLTGKLDPNSIRI